MSINNIVIGMVAVGVILTVKTAQKKFYNNLARNTMNDLLKDPRNKEVLMNLRKATK